MRQRILGFVELSQANMPQGMLSLGDFDRRHLTLIKQKRAMPLGTAREFDAFVSGQLFFGAAVALSAAMSFVSSARAFGPDCLSEQVNPASLIAFVTAR